MEALQAGKQMLSVNLNKGCNIIIKSTYQVINHSKLQLILILFKHSCYARLTFDDSRLMIN